MDLVVDLEMGVGTDLGSDLVAREKEDHRN